MVMPDKVLDVVVIWLGSGDRLFVGTLGNGLHELFLITNITTKNTVRAFIYALALSSDGKYLAGVELVLLTCYIEPC